MPRPPRPATDWLAVLIVVIIIIILALSLWYLCNIGFERNRINNSDSIQLESVKNNDSKILKYLTYNKFLLYNRYTDFVH